MNSIDWGRGLLGIADASTYYFKKRPRDLTLRESVFLAAIIPNPSRFGRLGEDQLPKRFARKQMMKALQSLYRQGMISLEEFERSLNNPAPQAEELKDNDSEDESGEELETEIEIENIHPVVTPFPTITPEFVDPE